MVASADVLRFWFEELDSSSWWKKDVALDAHITQRFGAVLESAARCELSHWRDSATGRLAEIIVLDQFSRNIHRDTPASFANDSLALALAQEAVRSGDDQRLEKQQRSFVYMPYMHSESLQVHAEAMRLFEALDNGKQLDFERRHQAIIQRFGRYPHRNAILGRASSAQEIEFLNQPGSSF